MILLEYEAKQILKQSSIPVPEGYLVTDDTDLMSPIVLKSQVPIGGRGKLGGIKIVDEEKDLQQTLSDLRQLEIKGYLPTTILAEEKLAIAKDTLI